MSKKKDPPGYPGDEAIKQKFGEVMRELRLEKGLSIEEVDAFIDERMREDSCAWNWSSGSQSGGSRA